MKSTTHEQAIAGKANSDDLVDSVVDQLAAFNDGQDIALDFLSRDDVGKFCRPLGFKPRRNWGAMQLPQIAPTGVEGVQVVPEDEAVLSLEMLEHNTLARKHLEARICEKLDKV